MSIVVQLAKELVVRPKLPEGVPLGVRNYLGHQDIATFLRIRERAFARLAVAVRRWDESDFAAEMTDKPWWSPQRMWFAEVELPGGRREAVATVTLARRGVGPSAQPAVHWLAVDPGWQRHGAGRLLMATLEAYCWDTGHRRVCLETHAAWTAAAAFYERLGYRPVS